MHSTGCATFVSHQFFPFNNIEEDLEFIRTIDDLSHRDTLKYISDKMFIPFELNDQDHSSNRCDIDPHLNFYNSLNQFTSKCNYYFESSFNSEIHKACGTKDLFSLCHLNIRSLKKNNASLDAYLSLLDKKFTAIAINETWLQAYDCDLYGFHGYHFVERHRAEQRGGGVAICIAEQLVFSVRRDLSLFDPEIESMFVEIEGSMLCNKKLILGVVTYRPPNTDTSGFNEKINCIMELIKRENKSCYMMGDYNINIMNYETHSLTGEFVDVMSSNALMPLITRPTRVTATSATLIDNILPITLKI